MPGQYNVPQKEEAGDNIFYGWWPNYLILGYPISPLLYLADIARISFRQSNEYTNHWHMSRGVTGCEYL